MNSISWKRWKDFQIHKPFREVLFLSAAELCSCTVHVTLCQHVRTIVRVTVRGCVEQSVRHILHLWICVRGHPVLLVERGVASMLMHPVQSAWIL